MKQTTPRLEKHALCPVLMHCQGHQLHMLTDETMVPAFIAVRILQDVLVQAQVGSTSSGLNTG